MSAVYLKDFIDDPATGRPAVLQGYAAVFNMLSTRVYDGYREVFAPESFDSFLSTQTSPSFIFAHRGLDGLMALPRDVSVWRDSVGFAFQARNVKMNMQNMDIVDRIRRGIITQCSLKLDGEKWIRRMETASDGSEILVIVRTHLNPRFFEHTSN